MILPALPGGFCSLCNKRLNYNRKNILIIDEKKFFEENEVVDGR